MKKSPMNPLIVVLGATGTGKSQLAVELATRHNGEIINGDAMQMYDGLPIVTNKITAEEQKGVPHHLLGFVPLDEEAWRVGMFKERASKIIKEIRSRGRLPIVVGGTHYYTQSLLFEDFLVTEKPDIEDEASGGDSSRKESFPILDGPTEAIVQKLREVDPVMADHWHPNERRKLRRSLEIFLTTGKKASDIYEEQKQRKKSNKSISLDGEFDSQSAIAKGSTLLFWVYSDAEILKRRLDSRIDGMIHMGLLDEVKSMDNFLWTRKDAGIDTDLTRGIWVSIGWKEFEQYLQALKSRSASPEELAKLYDLSVERTKAATRQYAKRQVRWIRLKLMTALLDEDSLDKLYLLDGSDLTKWETAVSNPAIDITARFLEGSDLPSSNELSRAAKEVLSLNVLSQETKDTSFRRECEICHVTAVVEHQWLTHLKSRRHRALEKRRLRNSTNSRSKEDNDS
ncbi:hypothetical protein G7Y89_g10691 [Cudoniella acicularis]|uniref:tRNA dimethylallyltransferase n=1 Tax=Cudoniella acicularis TaxID=354080 RepID=A0A8H4RDT8_9HELO|nr:hypothetical protein G7Y89_g10691 [Cudoniella acicularis]